MSNIIRRIILGCALLLVFGLAMTAQAVPVTIVGNSNPTLATATVDCTFNPATNSLTFTITNTSPFDARITGIGFDLVGGDFSGNNSSGLSGFAGANVAGFTFGEGDLGNVPQFNSAVLDFGWTTGNSANFNGGSANDGIAPGASLAFTVSGASFAGLTEEQICNAIFVRFQQVGADGQGSDVGVPGTPIPEPATMLLLGSGLAGVLGAIKPRARSAKAQLRRGANGNCSH